MSVYAVTCSWDPSEAKGMPRGRQHETVVLDAPSGDHAYRRAHEMRPDLPLESRPDLRATVLITPVTTVDLDALQGTQAPGGEQ